MANHWDIYHLTEVHDPASEELRTGPEAFRAAGTFEVTRADAGVSGRTPAAPRPMDTSRYTS